MKMAFHIVATLSKLALVMAIVPALAACSSDSGESGSTTTVSLSALQSQMGYSSGSTLSSPTSDPDNEATSVALNVTLGAMKVSKRTLADGPYSDRTPIVDVEVQLEEDLRDSGNFIKLRDLPTAEDAIEIELHPPGSEKWQLVAAGLRTQPQTVEELGDPEHQDAVIYIGFDPRFLTTNSSGEVFALDSNGAPTGNALDTLTITLIRACLVEPQDPPKGCAQYNTDGTWVITGGVEITSIFLNGDTTMNLLTFPLIVREGATGDCTSAGSVCDPIAARSALSGLVQAGDTSVEVVTTHQLAPNATPACAGLGTTDGSALEAACGTETFFTPL